jgi:hypothetical protein
MAPVWTEVPAVLGAHLPDVQAWGCGELVVDGLDGSGERTHGFRRAERVLRIDDFPEWSRGHRYAVQEMPATGAADRDRTQRRRVIAQASAQVVLRELRHPERSCLYRENRRCKARVTRHDAR